MREEGNDNDRQDGPQDGPQDRLDEEPSDTEQELSATINSLEPGELSGSEDLAEEPTENDFDEKTEDTALIAQGKEPSTRKRGRGFMDFLIVLVLAGLGVGEYLLIEKQKAGQNFVNTRLAKIEQDLQTLKNQKLAVSTKPSAQTQSALDNLTAQIQGLKQKVDSTRRQQEETRTWVKGEMEKMQTPPVEQEPSSQEESQEKPDDAEEAEPDQQKTESENANPEDSFIEFVENIGAIVINGIKDGAVFVFDKLSDLIDPTADSPSATPASNR